MVTGVARSPRPGCDTAADLTAADEIARCFASAPPPDVVVHLAALAHGKGTGGPGEFDRINHRATAQIIHEAQRAGVQRLVLASSTAVYGNAGRSGPVPEDAERRPVGSYARSKRNAEDACSRATADGFACVVLRFPAIYSGEWLLDLRKRAYVPGTGNRLLLRIPGEQPKYALCAVQNAVQAVRLAVEGRLPAGTYNVADARPYEQREVAAVLGELDDVSRSLPLPRRFFGMSVGAAMTLLPGAQGERVREQYWKLFNGLDLDLARIRSAGYRPTARLHDLLEGGQAG